jgi:hypothetical protein
VRRDPACNKFEAHTARHHQPCSRINSGIRTTTTAPTPAYTIAAQPRDHPAPAPHHLLTQKAHISSMGRSVPRTFLRRLCTAVVPRASPEVCPRPPTSLPTPSSPHFPIRRERSGTARGGGQGNRLTCTDCRPAPSTPRSLHPHTSVRRDCKRSSTQRWRPVSPAIVSVWVR